MAERVREQKWSNYKDEATKSNGYDDDVDVAPPRRAEVV